MRFVVRSTGSFCGKTIEGRNIVPVADYKCQGCKATLRLCTNCKAKITGCPLCGGKLANNWPTFELRLKGFEKVDNPAAGRRL